MKFEIKHRVTSAVIFSCEANNIKEAVEQAVTGRADLSRADLSGAYLSRADLSRADLSRADLSGAYLKNGELLVGKRPVICIGPVGSRSATFTAFITDKGLRFDVGCQRCITKEYFIERLQTEHGDGEHAQEYMAALEFVDAHARIWTPKAE